MTANTPLNMQGKRQKRGVCNRVSTGERMQSPRRQLSNRRASLVTPIVARFFGKPSFHVKRKTRPGNAILTGYPEGCRAGAVFDTGDFRLLD